MTKNDSVNSKFNEFMAPSTLFVTTAIGMMAILAGLWSNPVTREQIQNNDFVGVISYYGQQFAPQLLPSPVSAAPQSISTTSPGPSSREALAGAHRTLPIGTKVKVENLKNNKSAIIIITEHGPNDTSRELNVSEQAALKLGFKKDGTTRARITPLNQ